MRDSPCTPRLRSVSSYGNIRAVTTARNLNKSLQNLSLTEEREMLALGVGFGGGAVTFRRFQQAPPSCGRCVPCEAGDCRGHPQSPWFPVQEPAWHCLAGQVLRPRRVRAQLQAGSGWGANPRFQSLAADCGTGGGIQCPC